MEAGGSGLYLIVQVKLIVLPISTCKSGPPKMVAVGTVKMKIHIIESTYCTYLERMTEKIMVSGPFKIQRILNSYFAMTVGHGGK